MDLLLGFFCICWSPGRVMPQSELRIRSSSACCVFSDMDYLGSFSEGQPTQYSPAGLPKEERV